jgi:PAS domain S-box-containing protein
MKSDALAAATLRQRAQERMGAAGATLLPAAPAADPQRLLHELQVHQVELEMQNEQLEASRVWVEAALASYTELFDFAPLPYFTFDRNGAIVEVNLAGARLLGAVRADLLDRRFGLYVAERERRRFNSALGRLFGAPAQGSFETVLAPRGGMERTVQVEAALASDGETCRVVLLDVSERRAGSAAQERQAAAFAQAPEPLCICDAGGTVTDANAAFGALTGHAPAQLAGRALGDLHAGPQDGARQGALALQGQWEGAARLRHRDGHVLALRETSWVIRDEEGLLRHVAARFAQETPR